jgi:hypothetical protein
MTVKFDWVSIAVCGSKRQPQIKTTANAGRLVRDSNDQRPRQFRRLDAGVAVNWKHV